jgi:putative membrane protein insertion efficiency factor
MKRLLRFLLRGYQRWISPALLPACRYVPSCSQYALEAVELHGALRGSLLAGWRVLRCHPFVRGGYDPVPRPKSSPPRHPSTSLGAGSGTELLKTKSL